MRSVHSLVLVGLGLGVAASGLQACQSTVDSGGSQPGDGPAADPAGPIGGDGAQGDPWVGDSGSGDGLSGGDPVSGGDSVPGGDPVPGGDDTAVNHAPNPPAFPSMQAQLTVGTAYEVRTIAVDPDGDAVTLDFDLDGDLSSDHAVAVTSGATGSVTHTYATAGRFSVRARARDAAGATSPWSVAKTVTVRAIAAPTLVAGETGVVSAWPNAVYLPVGFATGHVALFWRQTGAPTGQVWVSRDGGAETLMAAETAGVVDAPWMQPDHVYRFALYQAADATAGGKGAFIADARVLTFVGDGPGAGMNVFDLGLQYLGYASSGSGTAADRFIGRAMAEQSLADLADRDLHYVRVSISGWSPHLWDLASYLDQWRTDPTAYWANFDELFADLAAYGIRIIPSLGWHIVQFAALTDETTRDLITNPSSASALLFDQYVGEFVNRYKDEPALYFYEMGNEYNLLADLDYETRSTWNTAGNFSSDELFAFTARFAALVRSLDPYHGVGSGHAAPRAGAQHLRASPEWSGADWGPDSRAEFARWLADAHRSVDVVSIHLYNGGGDNTRFGATGDANTDFLVDCASATERQGRSLMVGEYQETITLPETDPTTPYAVAMAARVAELSVPFDLPWAWQFYQFQRYQPNEANVEQGFTEPLLNALALTNAALGRRPLAVMANDQTPPRVLLTWPLAGTLLGTTAVTLYAVASDDHTVARVEFLLDGNLRATDLAAPFSQTLDPTTLATGAHTLTARAVDSSGNATVSSVQIQH